MDQTWVTRESSRQEMVPDEGSHDKPWYLWESVSGQKMYGENQIDDAGTPKGDEDVPRVPEAKPRQKQSKTEDPGHH